jgi:hypothetical protein
MRSERYSGTQFLGWLEFDGDLETTKREQSSGRRSAGRGGRVGYWRVEFETITGRKIAGYPSVQPNERRLF